MSIKNKIITVLIVGISAILATVFFAIWPTIINITNLSEKVYHIRLDLEKKYVSGQNLRHIIEKFKSIKAKSYNLNAIYVGQNNELELIQNLEKTAGDNSLDQQINIHEAANTEKSGTEMNLNLKLFGKYTNILKYLNEIRQFDYYININSITITKIDNAKEPLENRTESVSASITATFYINPYPLL